MPFSFWVRVALMEPLFETAVVYGEMDPVAACAAAVLGSHFMFWAGPATTMYQRRYVPDWTTAAFIQPLGLMEDVAVVLATWAADDPLIIWLPSKHPLALRPPCLSSALNSPRLSP
jgi:hypothetical protein